MNNFSGISSLLIIFALLTACASDQRVQSNHDDSLDFNHYETYGFSSRTEIETPDLPGTLELYFSAAVEQQMLLKGLERSDTPDILINVSVDVEDATAPPPNPRVCPRYDDYYSRRSVDSYGGKGRWPTCREYYSRRDADADADADRYSGKGRRPTCIDYYSRRDAVARYSSKGRRPTCIYTEGSINVDMVDTELNRTIWEGVSRVRIDEDKDFGAALARSVTADVEIMFGGSSPVRFYYSGAPHPF